MPIAIEGELILDVQNCGKTTFPELVSLGYANGLSCKSFLRDENHPANDIVVKPLQVTGEVAVCSNRACIFFDVTRLCELRRLCDPPRF